MWENNFAGIALLLVCAAMVALTIFARREQNKTSSSTFFLQLSCVSVFCWSFFAMLLVWIPDPQMAFFFSIPRFVGAAFMAISLCLHIRDQFATEEISRRRIALFFIPAGFCSLLALTNPLTGIFYTDSGSFPLWPARWAAYEFNWGFWLHCAAAYSASIIAVLMLIRIFSLVPKKMRSSINLMIVGALMLVSINIPMALGIIKPVLDPSIVASAIALWMFYFAHKRTLSANIVITSRGFVFNHLSFIIFILDGKRRILDYNNNAEAYFSSYNLAQFTGNYNDLYALWVKKENGRISPDDTNIVSFAKDGSESHYYIDTHELTRDGVVTGYLVEISDITRQFRVQRYLDNFAIYDQLTGLFNRNAYHEHLREVIATENMPLLVVMGDINNLKEVNDGLGHLVGDKLLQDVAGILRSSAPFEAFISRIGGDEFILLVPNYTEAEGHLLMTEIERLCIEFANPVYGSPRLALGCAAMQSAEQSYEKVFAKADKQMYKKKHSMKQGYDI